MTRAKHRRCEACGEYFDTWCNHYKCRQCFFTSPRRTEKDRGDYDEDEGTSEGQDRREE